MILFHRAFLLLRILPTARTTTHAFCKAQKLGTKPFNQLDPIIPTDDFDGKSKADPCSNFVYETDASSNQTIKALEDSGQAANTIVILPLFDLENDLTQKHNLAAEHPGRVSKLRALLKDLQA